jgi:outer membrane protein
MRIAIAASVIALVVTAPAAAQDRQQSVFDGDHLSVGLGAGYGPSYDGSDDYVLTPIPLLQGAYHGINIDPRSAGVALDFIPDPDHGVGFNLGVVAHLRLNRTRRIEDPVVRSLGKLDTAIEVGPTVGLTFPHVLNAYDSLSFNTDVLWDLGGAHEGMVADPGVSYFTPLSHAVAASVSAYGEYGDGKFADYYFSITPAGAAASGLPVFKASSGFTKVGGRLFLGLDLDGNLENGGFGLFLIGGYARMLGDAKRSPVTSLRGSADQWQGAIGLGYTF